MGVPLVLTGVAAGLAEVGTAVGLAGAGGAVLHAASISGPAPAAARHMQRMNVRRRSRGGEVLGMSVPQSADAD
jgi:hypothetical protein